MTATPRHHHRVRRRKHLQAPTAAPHRIKRLIAAAPPPPPPPPDPNRHVHWLALACLVAGLAFAAIGATDAWHRRTTGRQPAPLAPGARAMPVSPDPNAIPGLVPPLPAPPALPPAGEYVVDDNTVFVEISEYAGYAGLILANGGQLDANENSLFFRKYHFLVQLSSSESENWAPIQSGTVAASTTTADVLAAYSGQHFNVVVPAQIGYSSGADTIVVRSDVENIYGLKGRTIVVPQFTEADFLIRYLAHDAGLGVQPLANVNDPSLSPDKLNLVFASTVDEAQNAFHLALGRNDPRVAGALVWAPFDVDIMDAHPGQAHTLATTRDVPMVADVLIVNRGFAAKHPKMVEGLTYGLLAGNAQAISDPAKAIAALRAAFGWSEEEAHYHLGNVRLATVADNLAFMAPGAGRANTLEHIYGTARSLYFPVPPSEHRDDSLQPLRYSAALDAIKSDPALQPPATQTQPQPARPENATTQP